MIIIFINFLHFSFSYFYYYYYHYYFILIILVLSALLFLKICHYNKYVSRWSQLLELYAWHDTGIDNTDNNNKYYNLCGSIINTNGTTNMIITLIIKMIIQVGIAWNFCFSSGTVMLVRSYKVRCIHFDTVIIIIVIIILYF